MGKINSRAKIILDEDGNLFSIQEISTIIKRAPSTTYGWYCTHKCKTLKQFAKRFDYFYYKVDKEKKGADAFIYKTVLGELTAKQILKISKTTLNTVYSRMKIYGEESYAIFLSKDRIPFLEEAEYFGIETKKFTTYKTKIKEPKFDRAHHCYRNDFLTKCTKYSECQDYQLIYGEFPTYFKKDGSCFTTP